MATKKKLVLTQSQIDEIRTLLFKRVKDAQRRTKIIRLASSLAGDQNSTEFWSVVYHYSLEENWNDLDDKFSRYASSDFVNISEGTAPNSKKK